MRHGVDVDTQIRSDGVVVGEVLGDDGEDGPAMQTARLVRSRCRRVSYVVYRGRCISWPCTTETGEPSEYYDPSESAAMAGMEEAAGAELMPL
jgi:hypothetical protein